MRIYVILIICFILPSCYIYNKQQWDNNLKEDLNIVWDFDLFLEKNKKEEEKKNIEKVENDNTDNIEDLENGIVKNNIEIFKEEKKEESNEKFEIYYDVNFYSQFPLTWTGKYAEPYQNFCEEASLLSAYYYFKWINATKEKYIIDLNKLKEIEDKLFWEKWYKDTSVSQSLLSMYFFQNELYLEDFLKSNNFDKQNKVLQELITENIKKWWLFWKIKSFPIYDNKEDLKQKIYSEILSSLESWYLVIVPVYWKWLKNPFFSDWWPVYHNFLITWIKWRDINEWVFITQEVWISRGANYEYDKNIVLENIYDFNKYLYPDNFTDWKQKILVLFKDNNNLDFNLKDLNLYNK